MMAFFGWANVNDVTRFAKRMGKLLEAARKMLALPVRKDSTGSVMLWGDRESGGKTAALVKAGRAMERYAADEKKS
jgi:hypothetical protein